MQNVKMGIMALSVMVLFAACEAGDDAVKSSDGILQLGLLATGADGSIYRLPEGSQFYVVASAVSTYQYIDVDADQEMKIVTMSTGGYTGYLQNPAGSNAPWELIRVAPDGTESTVIAQLNTSFPYNFVINENQVTVVTMEFSVNSGENIVFTVGQLGINIAVQETSEPPTNGVYQADEFLTTSVTNSSADFNSLETAFSDTIGDARSLTASIDIVSDWILMEAEEKACASGNVTLIANNNDAPLWDAMREEVGTLNNYPICIRKWNDLTGISISFANSAHVATTPELISHLGTDTAYIFRADIFGWTSETLLSGNSLLLSKLNSSFTFDEAYSYFNVYTSNYADYVQIRTDWSNATIQFQ